MLIAHISYGPWFLFSFAETGQALVSSVDKIIFVGSPVLEGWYNLHLKYHFLSRMQPLVFVLADAMIKYVKIHLLCAKTIDYLYLTT
jgi:hypothetical protein